MLKDISELKKAEKALRESTEYLDRIINCLDDPVFVKDHKNNFVLVNEAFSKFTGKSPEELIGKTMAQYLPDAWASSMHDQDRIMLEAANGSEALKVAQQYSATIDLVLTDVVMPEMDGSTLVSQLKETRPDVKVLYFSGYADGAIVQNGVLDPNVVFLQKPFSASGLVRKVREVIDGPPPGNAGVLAREEV